MFVASQDGFTVLVGANAAQFAGICQQVESQLKQAFQDPS
jgi:hypothetical protein